MAGEFGFAAVPKQIAARNVRATVAPLTLSSPASGRKEPASWLRAAYQAVACKPGKFNLNGNQELFMKSAIVSISAAILLAGAGTAFAAMPRAHSQQSDMQSATMSTMHGSAHANCPQQLPTFDSVDTHNRGYITEKELAKAMKKQNMSTSHLASDFRHAETRHNGRLTQSQYNSWMAKCGG